MTTETSNVSPLYLVALPGAQGNKLFFTNDQALFDGIDPDLPEIHRDVLETHFKGFESFSDAATFLDSRFGVIAGEKWGFC